MDAEFAMDKAAAAIPDAAAKRREAEEFTAIPAQRENESLS